MKTNLLMKLRKRSCDMEKIIKYNIPDRVLNEITTYAKQSDINKIILFGSRARGDHSERSDIDIAVTGGDFDTFYWNVREKVHSLLTFDIINLDKTITAELQTEIEKDGITIYEKA